MPNHVHLVAVPERADSFARVLNQSQMWHAQHVNEKLERTGHLWQGRFYSAVLDESHAICAVRYVERNPVRARMVARAGDYPWSSARARVHGGDDPLLDPGCPLLSMFGQWSEYLAAPDEPDGTRQLQSATARGLPAGAPEFDERVGELLGRQISRRPPGRPRKLEPDPSF
jgi:putative transposase